MKSMKPEKIEVKAVISEKECLEIELKTKIVELEKDKDVLIKNKKLLEDSDKGKKKVAERHKFDLDKIRLNIEGLMIQKANPEGFKSTDIWIKHYQKVCESQIKEEEFKRTEVVLLNNVTLRQVCDAEKDIQKQNERCVETIESFAKRIVEIKKKLSKK